MVARHLLRGFADEDRSIAQRFFARDEPRLTARLAVALTKHTYTLHTRELAEFLWRAIAVSRGCSLDLPPGLAPAQGVAPARIPGGPELHTDPRELSREQVLAALVRCGGVRDRAWRDLGLRSRDQLKRLIKKHQID